MENADLSQQPSGTEQNCVPIANGHLLYIVPKSVLIHIDDTPAGKVAL